MVEDCPATARDHCRRPPTPGPMLHVISTWARVRTQPRAGKDTYRGVRGYGGMVRERGRGYRQGTVIQDEGECERERVRGYGVTQDEREGDRERMRA
jgi:hypothetical protein